MWFLGCVPNYGQVLVVRDARSHGPAKGRPILRGGGGIEARNNTE